jgi:hypothetical protein
MWETISVFCNQCERSLVFLSPFWKSYEAAVWEQLWVILEVPNSTERTGSSDHFRTRNGIPPTTALQPPYNVTHCAFLVTLRSGQRYVVDPIDIQFGTHRLLICKYRHYRKYCMHKDREHRNERCGKLGRNREVLSSGRHWEL